MAAAEAINNNSFRRAPLSEFSAEIGTRGQAARSPNWFGVRFLVFGF